MLTYVPGVPSWAGKGHSGIDISGVGVWVFVDVGMYVFVGLGVYVCAGVGV